MKKIKVYSVCIIVTTIILYLSGSLICACFYIPDWNISVREGIAWAWCIMFVVLAVVIFLLLSPDDLK